MNSRQTTKVARAVAADCERTRILWPVSAVASGSVGSNPTIAIDLLAALAVDENGEVRGGVVVNSMVKAMIDETEHLKDVTRLSEFVQ